MNEEQFKLKVCTPVGVAAEEDIIRVKVPVAAGEIEVLPGHRDYTGLLGIGILEFETVNDELGRLVTERGICTLADGILTLLTDSVYSPEAEELEEFRAEKTELEAYIDTADSAEDEYKIAMDRLACIESIEEFIKIQG